MARTPWINLSNQATSPHLPHVVGRDLGGNAHRNAAGAVDQQVGQAGRQHGRLILQRHSAKLCDNAGAWSATSRGAKPSKLSPRPPSDPACSSKQCSTKCTASAPLRHQSWAPSPRWPPPGRPATWRRPRSAAGTQCTCGWPWAGGAGWFPLLPASELALSRLNFSPKDSSAARWHTSWQQAGRRPANQSCRAHPPAAPA